MQDQAELVGARIAARSAIGSELGLVQLDEVLHLATGAVDSLVEIFSATVERGDDVSDIETFLGRFDACHEPALALPAFGAVAKLGKTAQPRNSSSLYGR